MRIAVVSDIHDNLTALEAVLSDLKETGPDLVLHGGDLVGSGSSPVEVVDLVRDRGWPGVCGNTDEMIFSPRPLSLVVDEMAGWTRDRLGAERTAWLKALPRQMLRDELALLHASPGNVWRAPADDEEFAELNRPLAVYGHTHLPFVRGHVANSGSVGMPFDGDPRACYLLIDDGKPALRRVEYDVDRETRRLRESGLPQAEWMVRMLLTASPSAPP